MTEQVLTNPPSDFLPQMTGFPGLMLLALLLAVIAVDQLFRATYRQPWEVRCKRNPKHEWSNEDIAKAETFPEGDTEDGSSN